MTISQNFRKSISPVPSSSIVTKIWSSSSSSKTRPVLTIIAFLNSDLSIAPDPSASKNWNARRMAPSRPSIFSPIFVRTISSAASTLMPPTCFSPICSSSCRK